MGNWHAIILATGVAILAQPAVVAPNIPAAKAIGKWQREVCRREVVAGSLIPEPMRCHTLAQWEEHAIAGQAIARKLVMSGMGSAVE